MKVTEVVLAKTVWWWRRGGEGWEYNPETAATRSVPPHSSPWKFGLELAAWRYELIRRYLPDKGLPPFPETDEWLKDFLLSYFGQTRKLHILRPIEDVIEMDPDTLPGEERQWFNLSTKVNLKAADDAIEKAILYLVNAERLRLGIPRPKQKQGKRSRGPSWRWPELMDMAFHGLPLGDGHSKLSQARRHARSAAEYFASFFDKELTGELLLK